MRVYQIFIPELNTHVKFKVMPPEDVSSFLSNLSSPLDESLFYKLVLDNYVFNMKTEIRESLKMMSSAAAKETVEALYNGCVMLNPGLDIDTWTKMAYEYKSMDQDPEDNNSQVNNSPSPMEESVQKQVPVNTAKRKKLSNAKFINLQHYLSERIIGQPEAIATICNSLKRSQVGLADEKKPLGVFLFAGASGVGKTSLAKELHKYLFGADTDMVRIDCGEYQHKHENQKLIGAPPGYLGFEDGGQLTNAVAQNPQTVVLLDEVEKAHPDLWNTFLRIFDEGMVTDNKGNVVDFRSTIIIMTTNLGNDKVVNSLVQKSAGFNARIETTLQSKTVPARSAVESSAKESIQRLFKPEFLNRIEAIVVFNHLAESDYERIANMELHLVDEKLAKKGISFSWDETAIEGLLKEGVNTIMGARGLAQVRRDRIETKIADILLDKKPKRGSRLELYYDTDFEVR